MPTGNIRYVICLVVLAISLIALTAHGTSAHAAGYGGARMPGAPRVSAVRCLMSSAAPCPAVGAVAPGGTLRLLGQDLDATERIVFQGARGEGDDVSVPTRHARSGHLDADVPANARSGPLALVSTLGATTTVPQPIAIQSPPPSDMSPNRGFFLAGRRTPTFTVDPNPATVIVELVRASDSDVVRTWDVEPAAAATTIRWDGMLGRQPAASGSYSFRLGAGTAATRQVSTPASSTFDFYDHVFPIRGKHDLGQSNTNNFGGGRGHQGQDMFARCGVPLAAAQGGIVKRAGTESRSGNYVVITGRGGDYVYMHLDAIPLVITGQRVFTGQAIGEVGDTGNASGCHLHFELWRSPGWYTGGEPVDALALLTSWDEFS